MEWLTEKVDALTSKLKAEPREDEEVRGIRGWDMAAGAQVTGNRWSHSCTMYLQAVDSQQSWTFCMSCFPQEDEESMGDVDLWELADEGNALTVNAKWLQHLQDRLLGEDGHPRKVGRCSVS